MSDLNRSERLQPSLLDRLTDLAPEQRRESMDQQTLTMVQLRRAVLRDLSWLLNATNLMTIDDDIAPNSLVARSGLNFGIPGIAGVDSNDARGSGLEQRVADAIRAFEPRIRPDSLKVRSRPFRREEGLPTLVLEISGELWAQPVPQQLFLETSIELETRMAVVVDAKGRPSS